MKIQLSPSTLSLYKECPRCFWLRFNEKIHRPRGIFPTLPGGMDAVIKVYFDKYRKKGSLPPDIDGKVVGSLFSDTTLLAEWRDWRTGLRFYDKDNEALLRGALDDCLVDDGHLIPIDYKTRGYAPSVDDSKKYYSAQLNCYSLLLLENGYKVRDFAYLVYYYPLLVNESGIVQFKVETIRLDTDPENARQMFKNAVDLLRSPLPEKHSSCEYCGWLENFMDES